MSAKSPESRAVEVSDHLGRLLAHADGLLAEWKAYSESLRHKLDAQSSQLAQSAADAVREPLLQATRSAIDELAGVGGDRADKLRRDLSSAQASVDALRTSLRGGGGSTSRLGLGLQIATLVAAIAAVGLVLRLGSGGSAPAALIADAGPMADARVVYVAAVDAAPQAPPPPCTGLRKGAPPSSALALIRSCAAVACGHSPSARDLARDKKNTKLALALKSCKAPDADTGLYRAMAELVGNQKRLTKCSVPQPNSERGYDVSPAWIGVCSGTSGP